MPTPLHVPLPFDAFVSGVARVDARKLPSQKKKPVKAAKVKKKGA
jgi:hypothetical protein